MLDVNMNLQVFVKHIGVVQNNELKIIMASNCLSVDNSNSNELPHVTMDSIVDNFCEYWADDEDSLKKMLSDIKKSLEEEIV